MKKGALVTVDSTDSVVATQWNETGCPAVPVLGDAVVTDVVSMTPVA